MLAVFRLAIIAVFFVLSALIGLLWCVIRPFHKNHVHTFASWFGKMAPLFGVKIAITYDDEYLKRKDESFVYVANHQNNYDLFTVTNAVPANTVSIGKKSLKFIPFFGQLYWLSGNILIDRGNRTKAASTLATAVSKIKNRGISVWMFPEGTRSYGRGLLPFKTGAFHTAMQSKVPVVPVAMSSSDKIKLNRLNNGTIYIHVMAPYTLDDAVPARDHAAACHEQMKAQIARLDALPNSTANLE